MMWCLVTLNTWIQHHVPGGYISNTKTTLGPALSGITLGRDRILSLELIAPPAQAQGHITLGFHLTGDGTSSAHKKNMKCRTKEYSEAIISGTLNRGEGLLVYNSYYIGSFSYGTAATSPDIKECEEIQRPVVNAILPKMGINRNASRSVVFRTSKYGALGLDHMAAVQGFGQLQYLIGSLRAQDITCDLYQMLLEYTQLECSTATPILEANFARYEHAILTKSWITECWRYLSLCNSSVTISGI
jgi:hypothetical protein